MLQDAAQCHAQWGLDGHSAEYMPMGAWDLSRFDRELSAVAMSEVSSISPRLFVTPGRSALGSSIPELSKASTEPTQRVACISPLEFLALQPGNGSKADTDFDLDRDVFHPIVQSIVKIRIFLVDGGSDAADHRCLRAGKELS